MLPQSNTIPASPKSTDEEDSTSGSKYGVEVLGLADAVALWNFFSDDDPCGAAQTIEWVSTWAEAVNPEILVGVVRTGGRPVLLLPLEIVSLQGARVARYIGGTHANANFPLIAKTANKRISAATIQELMERFKQDPSRPDAVLLTRQCKVLSGIENPLLCMSSMESPNLALSFVIDCDFENLIKHRSGARKLKKMRQQARRMDDRGGWAAITAKDPVMSVAFIDAFFVMKAKRFEEFGQKNTFDDPRIMQFFRSLFAIASNRPNPAFVLDALKVGDDLLAVSGSTIRHGTKTVEFGAVRAHEPALSPGDFLYHQLIKQACDEGFAAFDFGVGDEPYKRSWCDIETKHADSMKAFTAKGRVYVIVFRLAAHTKRIIKRNNRLFSLVKKWRRRNAPTADTQD
jgi:CelD/BcsL family acetyltransferase involved in cellulose biosynthesis